MQKKLSGFTLVEMLFVVAIIGVIAAVSLPSYRDSVVRSKRAEGRAALLKIMQQQERYYSLHSTYVAFSSTSTEPDTKKFSWHSADQAASSLYEISGAACPGEDIRECVALTAEPGTSKVDANFADPACGSLVLTSRGKQSGKADFCW